MDEFEKLLEEYAELMREYTDLKSIEMSSDITVFFEIKKLVRKRLAEIKEELNF
jgi:hypothetical protein